MNRLNGVLGGILATGFAAISLGFLTIGTAAAGDVVSSQQILDALTAGPKATVDHRPAADHALADLR